MQCIKSELRRRKGRREEGGKKRRQLNLLIAWIIDHGCGYILIHEE